ncbi:unnamed protein product [Acanthosepion pharaonis]|uniref:Uncharacterized protein n=1 Tax=Acanthosepion pharaonis TaxID=158019 RepID=A0A812CRG2_ACAPH|nr:unnamed protein product [Sepia pharaonis]
MSQTPSRCHSHRRNVTASGDMPQPPSRCYSRRRHATKTPSTLIAAVEMPQPPSRCNRIVSISHFKYSTCHRYERCYSRRRHFTAAVEKTEISTFHIYKFEMSQTPSTCHSRLSRCYSHRRHVTAAVEMLQPPSRCHELSRFHRRFDLPQRLSSD